MEFSNPKVDALVFDRPWLDDRLTAIEGFNEASWSYSQAQRMRNDQLVGDVHRATAKVADYIRAAQGVAVVNDIGPGGAPLEKAEVEGGSLRAPAGAPYVSESEFVKLQREETKARAALAEFQKANRPTPGRKAWSDVLVEAKRLITDLTLSGHSVEPYVLDGKPSREAMEEAAKMAEAGHARLRKVLDAHPDYATAQAMVRGLVNGAKSPLRPALRSYSVARDLRVPLIDVIWGPGRSAPIAEDVAAMFNFLAADRITEDLLEQLETQYADFERRGVLILTEAQRLRELALAREAIHTAELTEAAHLIGLIESDGVKTPPARMSARALLGIL